MPINTAFGGVLQLNGTAIPGTFTNVTNTGNIPRDFSLAGSAIINGGGVLRLILAATGGAINVTNADITITELN